MDDNPPEHVMSQRHKARGFQRLTSSGRSSNTHAKLKVESSGTSALDGSTLYVQYLLQLAAHSNPALTAAVGCGSSHELVASTRWRSYYFQERATAPLHLNTPTPTQPQATGQTIYLSPSLFSAADPLR